MRQLVPLCLVFLSTACSGTKLFWADFEQDTPGQAPPTSPPGPPNGDKLGTAGATVIDKVGVPPSVVQRHLLRLEAGTEDARVNCTLKPRSVRKPGYDDGGMTVIWNGWSEGDGERPLTLEARVAAPAGLVGPHVISRVTLRNGKFDVEGFGELPGDYSTEYPHTVIWSFDMEKEKFTFGVLIGYLYLTTGQQDFIGNKRQGLQRIHFGFAGAGSQPMPDASYYLESIGVDWAK